MKDRYPKHSLPTSGELIPPWGRVVLYVVAIVAPFIGLVLGHIEVEETVAVVIALAGVIGPVVATVQERKQADEHGAHFRAGYGAAVAEHVEGSQAIIVPEEGVQHGPVQDHHQ